MDLMQVGKGKRATVIRVKTDEKIRRRLKSFDVYPGVKVKVVRRSLFSGGVLVDVNGALISISREIAQNISVMRIDE